MNHPIKEFFQLIDPCNRDACLKLLLELESEPFRSAPGSSHNHQAWSGGYLDHVFEVLQIAVTTYASLSSIRELPFTLSDALLVLFLHDIEKPYKYGLKLMIAKAENHEFRLKKIEEFCFKLTDQQLNGLRYVEGENADYSSNQRVMGPLAAFCHMCDICSARIWFDKPEVRA